MSSIVLLIKQHKFAVAISLIIFLLLGFAEANWSMAGLIFFLSVVWMVSSANTSKNDDRVSHQNESNQLAESSELHNVSVNMLSAMGKEYDIVKNDLQQGQFILNDAINELQQSFQILTEKSTTQSNFMHSIIKSFSGQDNDSGKEILTFEDFAIETAAILDEFVNEIVNISVNSMSMVHVVEDIGVQMGDVYKLLDDVKSIADQTNLLALNAAIEAARAGEVGRGFAVVADEVRNLSQNSNRFSDEIRTVVSNVMLNIEKAKSTISKMASKDMNTALASKEKVNTMFDQTAEINEKLTEHLRSIEHISEEINESVGVAIRSLQFEDMMTQIFGHSIQHMDKLLEVAEMLQTDVFSSDNFNQVNNNVILSKVSDIAVDLEAFTDNTRNKPNKAVDQSSMSEGEVELF